MYHETIGKMLLYQCIYSQLYTLLTISYQVLPDCNFGLRHKNFLFFVGELYYGKYTWLVIGSNGIGSIEFQPGFIRSSNNRSISSDKVNVTFF